MVASGVPEFSNETMQHSCFYSGGTHLRLRVATHNHRGKTFSDRSDKLTHATCYVYAFANTYTISNGHRHPYNN